MKKNFKRALSAALVVVMLFTAFPAAFAFGSKETNYTIISGNIHADGMRGNYLYKDGHVASHRANSGVIHQPGSSQFFMGN